MSDRRLLISIIIMAVITLCLRALPFIVFKERKTPKWLEYLGRVLPFATMGMLVVYCMKGTDFSRAEGFLPELAAIVVVVLSYIWKKNTLLSIISGTVIYMVLIQFVF